MWRKWISWDTTWETWTLAVGVDFRDKAVMFAVGPFMVGIGPGAHYVV